MGVLDMQKLERARLTCTGQSAKACNDKSLKVDLGISSRPGGVPSTVIFQVTLVDFEAVPEPSSLPEEERLQLAEARKEAGNALFRQQRWTLACERYKRVID